MSKETFDFSEALRRMKQGKKVGLKRPDGGVLVFHIGKNELNEEILIAKNPYERVAHSSFYISVKVIIATDWEELK